MKHRVAALAGLALAIGLAVPANASTQDRFTIDDVVIDTFSCGVIETTAIHGDGTAWFDADGNLTVVSIHFRYDGTFVDPASGRTIYQTARQNVTDQGDRIVTRGQGTFLRLPGEGVVMYDVGRLVLDPADGATLKVTPHVITFDDPTAAARADEAVCGMFD
jgi:hypothetical protein